MPRARAFAASCWPRRGSSTSTARAACGSPNCSPNWPSKPTSSVCSTACTPTCRPIRRRSCRCTPASSSSSGRRWAPGRCTAWAPRTRTCPASSPSVRRSRTAARPTTAAPSCRPSTRGRRFAAASAAVSAAAAVGRPGGSGTRQQHPQPQPIHGRPADAARFHPVAQPRSPGTRSAQPRGIEGAIESFELAFRMQKDLPKVMDLANETAATKALYGIGEQATENFGRQCLLARRFVEAGVRFVEITSGGWDHHRNLKNALANKAAQRRQADRRPARGPEAARPAERHAGNVGRRVRPHALRPGHATAATTTTAASPPGWPAAASRAASPTATTDDYGYEAVEGKVHIHDWHATILHLLGLDHDEADLPLRRPRHAADRREGRTWSRTSSPDIINPGAGVYVSRNVNPRAALTASTAAASRG